MWIGQTGSTSTSRFARFAAATAATGTTGTVAGRARVRARVFLPSPEGMGGDETPIPKIPTLRAVSDAALAAFADASKREVAAERDARRRGGGGEASVRFERERRGRRSTRRVKLVSPRRRRGASSRVVSSTRTSERRVRPSRRRRYHRNRPRDRGRRRRRRRRGFESPAGGEPRRKQHHRFPRPRRDIRGDALVRGGGRREEPRRARRTRPGGFPQRLARPTCRIRVHRRDVRRVEPFARRPVYDVPGRIASDEASRTSVWTPLDARGYFRGERPAPLGGIPSIDPNRDDSYLRPRRSPRRPTVAEPFVAVVARSFTRRTSAAVGLAGSNSATFAAWNRCWRT